MVSFFQDETPPPNYRHQEISPEEKGQQQIASNHSNRTGSRLITSLKSVPFNLEEQFTVDIFAWLRENPLHRFSFDLTFDPSVLQVVRVEEGTVLSSDGAAATWWGEPEVDNEKGVITHIACRRTGKEGVAKRKGVLAVATFKAAKAGTSDVTLQNLRLMTPNGEEIPAPARAGAVDIYPHGSISGVVRAARSKIPLSEGQIEVSRNGFAFRVSTYSDRQGKYTLDGVPVGRFDVTAFSPMYIETTTEIEVKGRKMTSNVDFELTLVPLASAGGDASIGQPAPDFTLEDLNGNSVNLSALKGAPAILHFWASWSSPCRDQVAHLEALWKKYKAQGLTLIGMNNESDHANAKAFARDKISYPVALDGWAAFEAYGVSEVPCICYIDREGIVRYRDVGFGSGKEEEIERKIKELLH